MPFFQCDDWIGINPKLCGKKKGIKPPQFTAGLRIMGKKDKGKDVPRQAEVAQEVPVGSGFGFS